ncbi:type II toxin-antitoxin system RelE/ParE family toxin [Xenorhabdus sp. XENO-10]|uniref:Type II toxin-antitoxin system RelE/ParE family toxin n=1 Tax=Xenorhabdus yunnanensis TaxID=3025878 RepID=A0ABT5LK81_9GAMM|nr:type II toxin-antitoxin system RelE/ParE family toxin [Xenorhabdus yunnanensis]MDC9591535.1 type II toxin-antitoxin system RelE/ParE family toxin [Xenorhabdus yunnanensis]
MEIRRFTVKQWDEAQSKKYLSELQQTFHLLAVTPSLGRLRQDVGAGVLSFPHVSHVIYYINHEKQLVVFGILHKRMVPANHLDGREVI